MTERVRKIITDHALDGAALRKEFFEANAELVAEVARAMALSLTAGGKMAGLVVGAKVPVVVTSRGSSSEEKLLSLAVAYLVTQQEGQ